jgi:diguanylate cyclase (GGDEF)-like protein/PAS domain S-box-containing protein
MTSINYMDILNNLPMGIYFTNMDRQITYWNKSAEEITGYPAEKVINSHCHDNVLVHVDEQGKNLCTGLCPLAKSISDGETRQADVFLRHREGHRASVRVYTFPLKNDAGKIIGGIEIFSDISALTAMQLKTRELEKMAFFDTLTKLPNRNHILAELESMVTEYQRYHVPFGVLFLDIDHFKNFNDTYGHEAGDQLLKTVAATLRSSSRPFDVFGRWGGEEIVGVIRNVSAESLIAIGNRYRVLIEKSNAIVKGISVGISVSIGATMIQPEDSAETIVNRADSLMYQSKKNGRNMLTSDQ